MKKLVLFLGIATYAFLFHACNDQVDDIQPEIEVEDVIAPDSEEESHEGELEEDD